MSIPVAVDLLAHYDYVGVSRVSIEGSIDLTVVCDGDLVETCQSSSLN